MMLKKMTTIDISHISCCFIISLDITISASSLIIREAPLGDRFPFAHFLTTIASLIYITPPLERCMEITVLYSEKATFMESQIHDTENVYGDSDVIKRKTPPLEFTLFEREKRLSDAFDSRKPSKSVTITAITALSLKSILLVT